MSLFPQILFCLFAGIVAGGAISVILQKNPLYGAFSLILSFLGLSAIYIMLGAHFLGVIQIVVYAGAIMVLFVFVIMLLNVRREATHIDHHAYLKPLAAILGLILLAQLVFVVARVAIPQSPTVSPGVGTVETVGKELLTTYLLPFEATSVLILMAIIGSMHLAKREKE